MAGESASDAARRMREKADRLARSAELWERGAEGERATGAALATLPGAEWTVFNDVRWPGRRRANVDHVVVGPPGVFVIDSKNWSGRISVDHGVLRQNGRSRERAVAATADAAIAVAALTPVLRPDLVVPVLCFMCDDELAGWARDVVVCTTSNVAGMLSARPPRIDDATRRQLCLDLDTSLRSATEEQPPAVRPSVPPTPPTPPAPMASRAPSAVAARRIVGLLGVLAVLALAIALLIWSLSVLRDGVLRIRESGSRAGIAEVADITGVWAGTYDCGGGPHTARLKVRPSEHVPAGVSATFAFGPTDDNPDVPRGRFRLQGALSRGAVDLRPVRWIVEPDRYSMIGLELRTGVAGTGMLEVRSPACEDFTLRRR